MASSADISVALVAGEVSGDMLAGRLLAGLRPHLPGARFHGIGGPRMMEQGFVSDLPMDTLTVRGLFEVIPRYREIKRIQDTLRDRLLAERPAVAGLAVPGMPRSTPGMAVPGATPEPYEVVAFTGSGTVTLYASH